MSTSKPAKHEPIPLGEPLGEDNSAIREVLDLIEIARQSGPKDSVLDQTQHSVLDEAGDDTITPEQLARLLKDEGMEETLRRLNIPDPDNPPPHRTLGEILKETRNNNEFLANDTVLSSVLSARGRSSRTPSR